MTSLERRGAYAIPAVVLVAAIAWSASGLLARPALVLHLSSALAALVLGVIILARTKGTQSHRMLGRTWVALMSIAAVSSFWLTGLRDGFSWIHLLSIWTLVSLACAVWFIRRGNVRAHRGFMIGTFLGLAGAGLGALAPERLLYRFFFSA